MSDIIVGLDIGTSAIRAVVAEKLETGIRFHYHSRIKKSRDEAWNDYRNRYREFYNRTTSRRIRGQEWQPVATWDMYLRYKIGKNITVSGASGKHSANAASTPNTAPDAPSRWV